MKIKGSKSSGFSDINAAVLKEIFKVLIPELTNIFNRSITSLIFPSSWKKATVIPIPKKGDKKKVGNFRPTSLLQLPGKLLERLIHNQIESNLELSDFFSKNQFGFRKKHSTVHSIIQLVNHIHTNLDKSTPTAAVFIDFRKAFDCVNHEQLLKKLKNTTLGPRTIQWIENYLEDRQQQVLVNGAKSLNRRIVQGVPQRSTLGPLFYIIYANDIPSQVNSEVAMYADDTVFYTSSRDPEVIQTKLQGDLDKLRNWCRENKLTINADKTKLMIFGTKNNREKLGPIKVTFEGEQLETVTNYNHLGVKLDQTLRYDLHAKMIIQRVSDKIDYLKRIRRFINAKAAMSIYKKMILPLLEYGNILLISTTVETRRKLQTLQNKALKCAMGLDPLTGTKEVHRLAKLDPLRIRRKKHILQLMHKQQHSQGPKLWNKKRVQREGVRTRNSHRKLFAVKKCRKERYRKSITNKAPYLWNLMPNNIQDSPGTGSLQVPNK